MSIVSIGYKNVFSYLYMYVVMKSFYYPKLWQTVFKVIMKHAAMRDTVHGHMPLRGFVCLLREIDIIIMHMLVKRLHVLLYIMCMP